jgi:hypothetical protein
MLLDNSVSRKKTQQISNFNRSFAKFPFNSKIISFFHFFLGVISLMPGKIVPVLARATERTNNLNIIFS